MSDLPTAAPLAPASSVVRPTRGSEWTLFAVLIVLCLFALVAIYAIGWGHWGAAADSDRIKYLGMISIGAVICIGLLIAAFASPWIGTTKASGLGLNLEVDGTGGGQ